MNQTLNNHKKSNEIGFEDSPRILVIRRGVVSNELKELAKNLRFVFSPNCAISLKEGSKQKLRDFTSVIDVLGLTHLVTISESSIGSYMRIVKLPNGPTITFSIGNLSLMSDIAKHFSTPSSFSKFGNYYPLLVLDGFGSDKKTDGNVGVPNIISSTLNSMFAPIDLSKIEMQNCRRVLLFHKESDSDQIILRHYSINLVDVCTSNVVKELLNRKIMKKIIATEHTHFDQIVRDSSSSNHIADEELDGIIEVNSIDKLDLINKYKYGIEDLGAIDTKSEIQNKIAFRLVEIGPRLCLTTVKIQDGVHCGEVTYHKYIKKSPDEIQKIKVMEPEIIRKRRIESERIEKLYRKHTKKQKEGYSLTEG